MANKVQVSIEITALVILLLSVAMGWGTLNEKVNAQEDAIKQITPATQELSGMAEAIRSIRLDQGEIRKDVRELRQELELRELRHQKP